MAAPELSDKDWRRIQAAVIGLVEASLIPIKIFAKAYDESIPPDSPAPTFVAIMRVMQTDRAALETAVQAAVRDKFLLACYSHCFEKLPTRLPADNPDVAEILAVLQGLPSTATEQTGVMQSILNAGGLRDSNTLPALMGAAKATALISTGPGAFGTGFLVGPALMLTSAHVMLPVAPDGKAQKDAHERVQIQFHNDMRSQGSWPVRAQLAPGEDWLVAWSSPNGKDGKFYPEENAAQMAEQLDFALIKLAAPVAHLTGTVDVSNPPAATPKDQLALFGYGGGSRGLMANHTVLKVIDDQKRIHHGANAISGMSGGPCLDGHGRAVALHEGGVPPSHNRAVSLDAIRAVLQARNIDPVGTDGQHLHEVHDRDARIAWVNEGRLLRDAATDPAQPWLDEVAQFNPQDSRTQEKLSSLHPIFGRRDFQDWITAARLATARQTIYLLSGPRGSGRSFSATILKHTLATTGQTPTVVPSPVAVRPMREMLDRVFDDLGLAPSTDAGNPLVTDNMVRPYEGVIRRDVIPFAMARLEQAAKQSRSGLLWLFIDLGDAPNLPRENVADWKAFLIQAEKCQWLRLLIVGLRTGMRAELQSALTEPGRAAIANVEPLDDVAFKAFIAYRTQHLNEARRKGWLVSATDAWDQEVGTLSPQTGTLPVAVRAALEICAAIDLVEGGAVS